MDFSKLTSELHGVATMKKTSAKSPHQAGFTLIESMVALTVILIMAAVAFPSYQAISRNLRIAGDARNLNGLVAQAKMSAAAGFTHARAYADLGANTFHLENWNKAGNGGAGCWQTDGDTANPCTVAGRSPVQRLSQGVTFGFGAAGAGNPNPQGAIAQAPLCDDGNGGTIANTACIVFNSRGIPIYQDPNNPTTYKTLAGAGANAFYVTDANTVWGVTTTATSSLQMWASAASHTSWQPR